MVYDIIVSTNSDMYKIRFKKILVQNRAYLSFIYFIDV